MSDDEISALRKVLDRFQNVSTRAIVRGANDDVEVELEIVHHPPSTLKLQPFEVDVNGTSYVHGAQLIGDEGFDGRALGEGETLEFENVVVSDYTIDERGPGPAVIFIDLEEVDE